MTDELEKRYPWKWWYAILPQLDPVVQIRTGRVVMAFLQPAVDWVARRLGRHD